MVLIKRWKFPDIVIGIIDNTIPSIITSKILAGFSEISFSLSDRY